MTNPEEKLTDQEVDDTSREASVEGNDQINYDGLVKKDVEGRAKVDQCRIIQHPVATENTMKKIDDLMVRLEELTSATRSIPRSPWRAAPRWTRAASSSTPCRQRTQ